jgi:hypothetical protein
LYTAASWWAREADQRVFDFNLSQVYSPKERGAQLQNQKIYLYLLTFCLLCDITRYIELYREAERDFDGGAEKILARRKQLLLKG